MDKSIGDGGSATSGGGSRWSIADQRENLTSFMISGKFKASRAEFLAEKATINMGRDKGCGPGHLYKKVGLAKLRLLGGWRLDRRPTRTTTPWGYGITQ